MYITYILYEALIVRGRLVRMPSQSIVVIVIIVFFGVIAAHLTALRLINSHATTLYQKRNATDLKSYLE